MKKKIKFWEDSLTDVVLKNQIKQLREIYDDQYADSLKPKDISLKELKIAIAEEADEKE